jgi:MFS family permease
VPRSISRGVRWGEPVGAWWALFAIAFSILLVSGARSAFAPFLKPIEEDLGLDRATVSSVSAITQVAYGLLLPFFGHLAARVGAQPVLMVSVAVMAVGGFGIAITNSYWQLLLFAGLLPGIGYAGATHVPGGVLLGRWFRQRFGLATGAMTSAVPAGQAIFVPLATALIPVWGWRGTYILMGLLLAFVLLPVLWRFAREPAAGETRHVRDSRPSTRAGPDIWLMGAGFFACGFSDQFVSLHLITLCVEAGIEPLVASTFYSLLLISGVVGSILSGPLADSRQPPHILAAIWLSRALVLPLLLVVGPGERLLPLLAFAVLFGLGFISNQAPGARLVRDHYGVNAIGPLMGSVGMLHQIGGGIGMFLGGWSVAQLGGYGPAVLLAAVVALVGGTLQLFVRYRREPAAAVSG